MLHFELNRTKVVLASLFVVLLAMSSAAMINSQQAQALSAVAFTNRATITSDTPGQFQKLYHDTGATSLQFLDVNAQGQVTQDTYNTSSFATSSFTNPVSSAIVKQVPSSPTASSSTIGHNASNATDSNISTYWRSGNAGERPYRTSILPTSQYYFNGNANDGVGSNNLVAQGTPTYGVSSPSGISGQYIKFNGSSQFANATSSSVFNVGTESFSAWGAFYRVTDSGVTEAIFHKRDTSVATNPGYAVDITSADKLQLTLADGTASNLSVASSSSISTGIWYIWAGSFTRTGSMVLYLYNSNTGTLESASASISAQQGSLSSSQVFTLGRSSHTNGNFFPGYMDNLAFLDGTAITQAQFQEIVDTIAIPSSLYRFAGNANDSTGTIPFYEQSLVQQSSGGTSNAFTSTITRIGELFNDTSLRNSEIAGVRFYLFKTGSPTGSIVATIRQTSDDSIVATSVNSIDASSLSSSGASPSNADFWFAQPFPKTPSGQNFRVLVEYSGSTGTDFISLDRWNAEAFAGGQYTSYASGSYTEVAAREAHFALRFTVPLTYGQADSDITGQYLTLNGSTDFLTPASGTGSLANSNTIYDVTSEDFTISGFFYRAVDSGTVEHIVSKKQVSGVNTGYVVGINSSDQLFATVATGTSLPNSAVTGTTIQTGKWYYFVMSSPFNSLINLYLYDITAGTLYTGTPTTTRTGSATSSDSLTIGRAANTATGNAFFTGSIDNLAFIDGTALSQQQVGKLISIYFGAGGTGEAPAQGLPTPTSLYRFSGNLNDSIASNNLTNNGGITYAGAAPLGPYGQYASFNGVNQYATASSNSVFDVTTGSVSLWGFVNPTTSGIQKILAAKKSLASGTSAGYAIEINASNQLFADLADGTNRVQFTVTATTFSTNTWYFWAVSIDRNANTITAYIYNFSTGALTTLQGSISTITNSWTNTQVFTVGRRPDTGGNFYTGYMDNLAVLLGTAITAAQVTQLYSSYLYGDLTSPRTVTGVNIYENNPVEIPQKIDVYVSNSTSFPEAARQTFTTSANAQVGLWRFENVVGDSSGYGNNIVALGNTTVPTSGEYGNGLSFDGTTNAYAQVNDASNLQLTSGITLSTYVKWNQFGSTAGSSRGIISKSDSFNNGYVLDEATGTPFNRVQFGIKTTSNSYVLTSNTLLSTGVWYNIAATYDGSTMKLYINGVLDNTLSATGNILWTGTIRPLYFGALYSTSLSNNRLNGAVDEVHIYNTALTQPQIQNLMLDPQRMHTYTLSSPVVGQYVKVQVNTWMPTFGWTINEYSDNLISTTSNNVQVSDIETTNSFYSVGRNSTANTNTIAGRSLSTNGLAAWWSFDNNSVIDQSGTGNSASSYGTINYKAGKFGNALELDGTSGSFVNIPDNTSLEFTNGMTLSVWVYLYSLPTADSGIIQKSVGGTPGSGYNLYVQNSGRVISEVRGNTGIFSAATLTPNTWYYLTVTFANPGNTLLYINGVQDGSVATSGNIVTSAQPFRIGAGTHLGLAISGLIDDVRAYNRALTPTEISNLYNSYLSPRYIDGSLTPQGLTQSTSKLYMPLVNATGNGALKLGAIPKDYGSIDTNNGLVGYWKLDDGSGGQIRDSSGMGYTLSTTGTINWIDGIRNKALNFDSAATSRTTMTGTPLDFSKSDQGSYGFWLRGHSVPTANVKILEDGSDRLDVNIEASTGKIFVWFQDSANQGRTVGKTSVTMMDGSWHHLFVSKTASQVAFYVDGAIVGTFSSTLRTFQTDSAGFGFGNYFSTSGVNIDFDDVRFYNRGLSQSEIKALYYGEYPLYTGTESVPVRSSYYDTTGASHTGFDLKSTGNVFVGERVKSTSSLIGKPIHSITAYLSKTGSPTGNAYVGVFDGVTGNLKFTVGTVNVADLAGSSTLYTYTASSSSGNNGYYTLASGDVVGVSFEGGDNSNYITVQVATSDVFDGTNSVMTSHDGASWTDTSGQDYYGIFTNNEKSTAAKSVVTNDGASEKIYTFFTSGATVRAVEFVTTTQIATLLPTLFSGNQTTDNFRVIPLNGKILVIVQDGTWEINTATDAVTKVFPVIGPHDETEAIPSDFETWITNVPQTFTISTSARTFSSNAIYLGSNHEARTYVPSTAAGPTTASLMVDSLDAGLNSGEILLHRPAQYYYYLPYLSLTIEPASATSTTWTIKSVGSKSDITLDAHHEFVQTVVSDPFHAYENVNYIYCGSMNWNVSAVMMAVGDYSDCTEWHVFANANITVDPVPRQIPFATVGKPVHAFDYDRYTIQLSINQPENYKIVSSFNGLDVDMATFDASGVAQQRYLDGNCYDARLENIVTGQTLSLGSTCANGVNPKTINLLTVNLPDNFLGTTWLHSISRVFGTVPNEANGTSTVTFSVLSSVEPYNASIMVTDHYVPSMRTYATFYNYTNQNATIVLPISIPNNNTVYFFTYGTDPDHCPDNPCVVKVSDSSSGKAKLLTANGGFPANYTIMGIGFPAFFLILGGGIFLKTNHNSGLIIIAALAGLMYSYGLIAIGDNYWGLLIVIAAVSSMYLVRRF